MRARSCDGRGRSAARWGEGRRELLRAGDGRKFKEVKEGKGEEVRGRKDDEGKEL